MSVFSTEQKRATAIRLIATGRCPAAEWPTLSEAVYNESVGILPDGRLITQPRPKREVPPVLSVYQAAGVAGVHPATIR
ncbi:MAG: hypothetical protein QHJ73_13230, partial [Armatimonadota bacterium]|nr:hypothetical protein [Armatimonadota bacterium]